MKFLKNIFRSFRKKTGSYADVFVNHTNHPSANWGEDQMKAAKEYGDIVDIPFPNVDPHYGTVEVYELAKEEFNKIMEYDPRAVLCQGEFVYVCKMAELLKKAGVKVLAACSERVVTETVDENGKDIKTSVFTFVRFREF